MTPIREPGFYWAKLDDHDGWQPVRVDEGGWVWNGPDMHVGGIEWGPKLESPDKLADPADRLDCAESELCRLNHHKRGDGCSIPGCRNYRPVTP